VRPDPCGAKNLNTFPFSKKASNGEGINLEVLINKTVHNQKERFQ
jgi:hypothetical protein